jgi:hypothetical protein
VAPFLSEATAIIPVYITWQRISNCLPGIWGFIWTSFLISKVGMYKKELVGSFSTGYYF